jgi:hypothetical protein
MATRIGSNDDSSEAEKVHCRRHSEPIVTSLRLHDEKGLLRKEKESSRKVIYAVKCSQKEWASAGLQRGR